MSDYSTSKKIKGLRRADYRTSKKLKRHRRKLAKLRSDYNDVMKALGTRNPRITKKRAPCGIRTTLETLKHKISALKHEIALGHFRLACA